MRYGLALLVLVGYVASFFIPLMTVTLSGAEGRGVMSVFHGGSPFDLHYLTIGIFPFLLAAIFHSVMKWQMAPFLTWLENNGISEEALKLTIAVFLACAMTYNVIHDLPPERFRFSIWITAAECLLSVYFVYEAIRWVRKTYVVGNPLMLFIGVNCLAAVAAGFLRIDYSTMDVIERVWFAGGCLFGIMTFAGCWLVGKAELSESVMKPIDPTGNNAGAKTSLRFPVMRAGITPVVYSAFLFFPLMSQFSSHSGATGLVLSPLWLLAYAFLVFVITYSLLKEAVPTEVITEYMRAKGILFLRGEDHGDVLKAMRRTMAILSTLWLTLLMVIQGVWQLYSPEAVSGIAIVGGLAPLLLLSVSKDMRKQYKTRTW